MTLNKENIYQDNNDDTNTEQKIQEERCRICFQNGLENEFIKPCLCTGTMAWVHQECLMLWRQTSTKAFFKCEQCHSEYKFKTKCKISKITNNPIIIGMLSIIVLVSTITIVAFFIGILLPPVEQGGLSQEEFYNNPSTLSYPPHINWRSLEGMKPCLYRGINILDPKNNQIFTAKSHQKILSKILNSHLAEILPASITITITCPLLLIESTQSSILAHLALLSMLYLATILYYNGLSHSGDYVGGGAQVIDQLFKSKLYNLLIFLVPSMVGLIRYYQLIRENLYNYTKTYTKQFYSELGNMSPKVKNSIEIIK